MLPVLLVGAGSYLCPLFCRIRHCKLQCTELRCTVLSKFFFLSVSILFLSCHSFCRYLLCHSLLSYFVLFCTILLNLIYSIPSRLVLSGAVLARPALSRLTSPRPPTAACHFLSFRSHPYVLSCPVLSCPVLSCPVLSCPSCPVLSIHVSSCPFGHIPYVLV
jgi:hypothetical protein